MKFGMNLESVGQKRNKLFWSKVKNRILVKSGNIVVGIKYEMTIELIFSSGIECQNMIMFL